jgi:hypothetical protein
MFKALFRKWKDTNGSLACNLLVKNLSYFGIGTSAYFAGEISTSA